MRSASNPGLYEPVSATLLLNRAGEAAALQHCTRRVSPWAAELPSRNAAVTSASLHDQQA